MFCKNCGHEIPEEADFCEECGVKQSTDCPTNPVSDEQDKGLNILSFFIPIIGIVLYFVKREEKPVEAKGVLKWALISIILTNVLPFVILFGFLFISLLIQML